MKETVNGFRDRIKRKRGGFMNKTKRTHKFVGGLYLLVIAALLAGLGVGAAPPAAEAAPSNIQPPGVAQEMAQPDAATKVRIQAALAQLPLYFVENRGQVDERVAYYVQGSDKTLYFTAEGVTFVLTDLTPRPPSLTGKGELHDSPLLVGEGLGERSKRWNVKLDFVNAN